MVTTDAERLYLDLLKRTLTRYAFADDQQAFAPNTPWKRRLWNVGAGGLKRLGVGVVRDAPFDPAAREEGRDWPASAETMVGLKRLDNIEQCIRQVVADDVPGDLLEAGVWRGGSTIFMRAVLAVLGEEGRNVWVADSFEGLPPPSGTYTEDAGDLHHTWDHLAVGIEQVRRNFERYGMLDDRVRFLQGWFKDTLGSAPVEQLALLRADGDMYESTMDILLPLYPKVASGGFVIIDDYYAVPACKAAVDDYRSEHGITDPMQRVDWTCVFWRVS